MDIGTINSKKIIYMIMMSYKYGANWALNPKKEKCCKHFVEEQLAAAGMVKLVTSAVKRDCMLERWGSS